MLSKSQYTKYLQCPKLFWLSRREKDKLTPPSVQQQQIFDTGSMVGDFAQHLFPGGSEVPFDLNDVSGMIKKTEELIQNGETSIYEASFLFDNIFAAVDILCFSEGEWHIYEVKSSTSVKDTHLDDVAIQYYVLKNCGIKIGSANLVCINNSYVKNGEIDVHELFSVSDITNEAIERQENIPAQVKGMVDLLEKDEPEISIGAHCNKPYECSGKAYCWNTLAGIPELSVFTLRDARIKKKLEFYNAGIVHLSDIPQEGRPYVQKLQIIGKEHIDRKAVGEFVSAFHHPIAHLDFESYQQAIPEYDGLKPYQQIPFQYSIHIETAAGGLEHKEFLAPVGVDPRRELAEQLLRDIPAAGTVLAYNKDFEINIIKKLAAYFDDLSEALLSIAGRIDDLMIPFDKGLYYHPDMNGSYSIKKVLPSLVPEMEKAYKNLPVVHNGGEASTLWANLAAEEDKDKVLEIRKGLLEYCKLDTLAMVKILKVLREV